MYTHSAGIINSLCRVSLHSAIHIVLVTDLVVLLTERDQKYQIAALQDLKVRYVHTACVFHIHISTLGIYICIHNAVLPVQLS